MDVAGVSLVCAIHHANAMVDEGPQRQLRHLTAAVKGFAGGHDGKWGWGGFYSAFSGYSREQVASKSVSMYRNFLLAALSRLHIKQHFDTSVIESATRQYALSSLKEVGKIHVGAAAALRTNKDFAHVCLADVVADQKWYEHLKWRSEDRPESLPDWLLGSWSLFAGDRYGSLVGLD